MDFYQSYRPRLKKNILSTHRKMKVLSAMDSGSKKCLFEESCESNSNTDSDHGREILTLLHREQAYVDCLKELKKCLFHPMLKTSIDSLDDIIGIVNEMLSTHSNFQSALLTERNNLSNALKKLSSILDAYVSYSILTNLELCNIKKFSELYSVTIIDLLHEPILHITRYKSAFKNLYSARPDDAYSEMLKAVEYTYDKIQNTSSLRKNALRTLQIQRLLIKRQPKILSPGRTVLKEGILYEVTCQGRSLKKRVFFLFSDILLCCKIVSSLFNWQEKDTLMFSSLFPLNSCTVNFVMGSTTSKGALFKVSCGSLTYLLLSKTPGESQTWVQELQTAIRACQIPCMELKPKISRRKNICIQQKISPFLKRTPRTLESTPKVDQNNKVETMNMSEVHSKPSSLGKLMKMLTCLKL